MVGNKVCRTIIRGGELTENAKTEIESIVEAHNFVCRLNILVNKPDLDKISLFFQSETKPKKVIFRSTLLQLVQFILELSEDEIKNIKLVTLDKDISHENSICITQGKLILKLRSDTYLKSGFQFKLSTLSHGNKQFYNQMYIHTFDMLKFKENVQKNSRNDIRLLWFAENINEEIFKFAITSESDEFDFGKLHANNLDIITSCIISPSLKQLDNCITPDLSITKDEDRLAETLEWLSYVSLGGEYLNSNVDSYISRYPSMIEKQKNLDLVVIKFDKVLISSSLQIKLLDHLFNSSTWFSVILYGVKNTTKSYRCSGEHSFVDDGTNDIVLFCNSNKYAFWEITDGGDPH